MLILAASNGHNLALAGQVAERAALRGHDTSTIDLVALDLPLFTPLRQEQGGGDGLSVLAEAVRSHRRLWVNAPEYNGSLPPTLVNAIAWLSTSTDDFRALFNGLPVALASHSGGGGQKVLSAMRLQLAHLGAVVIGRELLSTPQKPANPDSIDAMLAELHRLEAPALG
jgi:chromate reductase, NAD(P)H dehydrogenase (quinone)